jgi:hypothetical protein
MDNTDNNNLGSVSSTVVATVSRTDAVGLIMFFPEDDPGCGPGSYRLSSAAFAVAAQAAVPGGTISVNTTLRTYNESTGLGDIVAWRVQVRTMSTATTFMRLILTNDFLIDTILSQ